MAQSADDEITSAIAEAYRLAVLRNDKPGAIAYLKNTLAQNETLLTMARIRRDAAASVLAVGRRCHITEVTHDLLASALDEKAAHDGST